MNILTPFDSLEECRLLIKEGVKEFYCGYISKTWINMFGLAQTNTNLLSISSNKRCSVDANVKSEEELNSVAKFINDNSAHLFVTLNAFYYPDYIYPYLDEILSTLYRAHVYGIIVTDISLIKYIKSRYDFYLVLSCCNQVTNSNAVKFYKNLGINRITFPRHIKISEMVTILSEFPEMDFEVFCLDGKCIYDDGNCKIIHNYGRICLEQWNYEFYKNDNNLTFEEEKNLINAFETFNLWTDIEKEKAANDNNKWKNVTCTACIIPEIKHYSNLKALKISGRGLSLFIKISFIRLIKKLLICEDKNVIVDLVSKFFGDKSLCEKHIRCMTR